MEFLHFALVAMAFMLAEACECTVSKLYSAYKIYFVRVAAPPLSQQELLMCMRSGGLSAQKVASVSKAIYQVPRLGGCRPTHVGPKEFIQPIK